MLPFPLMSPLLRSRANGLRTCTKNERLILPRQSIRRMDMFIAVMRIALWSQRSRTTSLQDKIACWRSMPVCLPVCAVRAWRSLIPTQAVITCTDRTTTKTINRSRQGSQWNGRFVIAIYAFEWLLSNYCKWTAAAAFEPKTWRLECGSGDVCRCAYGLEWLLLG